MQRILFSFDDLLSFVGETQADGGAQVAVEFYILVLLLLLSIHRNLLIRAIVDTHQGFMVAIHGNSSAGMSNQMSKIFFG